MLELVASGITLYTDHLDSLHVWGVVENTGESTQRWVHADVRLLDGANQVLAQESDILALEWTPPGSRNPFHIQFHDPPEGWDHYEVSLSGSIHDPADPRVPQPHPSLAVSTPFYREIDRGGLRCSLLGRVTNEGAEAATRVKVAGTLYGPHRSVIGALSPYIKSGRTIAPGESQMFELKYYIIGGAVANFAVAVQGRLVTPTE